MLARVTVTKPASVNTITDIESSLRLGKGARYSSFIEACVGYHLFMDDAGYGFSSNEIEWMLTFLRNVSHPVSRGLLFTKKPSKTYDIYMYHADGYEYQGVV